MAVVTAGAMHGLLESLDPLSGYLSPREYADYRDRTKNRRPRRDRHDGFQAVRLHRGGLGCAGWPGGESAMRSGEILEAIAGFATRDMSVGQATALLQGAPGTSVKVAVIRRGKTEPQDVSINRAVIGPEHMVADRVGDDVAYVRMPALDPLDVSELHDKLAQFDKQGVHKLLLDLRDCTRGDVRRRWSPRNSSSTPARSLPSKARPFRTRILKPKRDKAVWRSSVDVLISPSTSGAAEVLAGAIKGNKRGELVGERTFGSASEQKIIPMDDGGALILTVAFYSTPDGKSIVEEGVAPTVEVHPKSLDPTAAPRRRPRTRRRSAGTASQVGRSGLQQGSRTAERRRASEGRLKCEAPTGRARPIRCLFFPAIFHF